MLSLLRNTHLIKRPMIGLKSEKSHFSNARKILLKQGVFRWVTNIHEHKDITIPLIIHYYFQSIQNTTANLSAKS